MTGRRLQVVLALLVGAVMAMGVASSGAAPAAPPTPAAVAAQFKKVTGRVLVPDRLHSRAGKYTAYTMTDSVTNRSLFGTFTLYVVTSGNEADAAGLLVNTHTGAPGTPGPSNIYWEPGRFLSGTPYYLGKKRYGTSVVLWWYGDQQKVDTRFKRIHKALLPFQAS